jgi:hypothetical protein
MPDVPFDAFTWKRPASRSHGFAWQPTGGLSDAELVEYQPDSALYRDFGDLEPPTSEAVLAFANKWGALRERLDQCPLDFWRDQIVLMRRAVALRAALEASDWATIRENLEPVPSDMPAARAIREKLAAGQRLSTADLENAASLVLTDFVARAESSLEVVVTWDAEQRKIVLTRKPADLLGWLWSQFARAIAEQLQPKQCTFCGRWFQPGSDDHGKKRKRATIRSDRQTCSDNCRVKVSQQRKLQAIKLHTEKRWKAARIAKAVGSDLDTVEGWISSHQESNDE